MSTSSYPYSSNKRLNVKCDRANFMRFSLVTFQILFPGYEWSIISSKRRDMSSKRGHTKTKGNQSLPKQRKLPRLATNLALKVESLDGFNRAPRESLRIEAQIIQRHVPNFWAETELNRRTEEKIFFLCLARTYLMRSEDPGRTALSNLKPPFQMLRNPILPPK